MNRTLQSRLFNADRLGILASSICAVHCLLTPVVLSLPAVWGHYLPSDEQFHRVIAVVVAGLGALAVVANYRRHRRRLVLFLIAAGLVCIFFGAYCGEELPSHSAEIGVTLLGSALMISAHRLNHTFCRDCPKCHRAAAPEERI
jgi:uncharacterized membrane protein YfcA